MVFTTESAESTEKARREWEMARNEAVHQAQVLSYLRLSGPPLALLINFHSATLKHGIRRYRNSRFHPSPSALPALTVVKNS